MKKFPKESYGIAEFEIMSDDETGELYLIGRGMTYKRTFKPEKLYETITEIGHSFKKIFNLDVAIKF